VPDAQAAPTPPSDPPAPAAGELPLTDLPCELVSFGRRKVPATKVTSLVEAATKGHWLGADPVPGSDAEVRAKLFAKYGAGVQPDDKAPLLFPCRAFGPNGDDWKVTCMLVVADGGGFWLADEISFPENGASCVPDGHPEVEGYTARLARRGGNHAVAPYFWCDQDGKFVERRFYETWVDAASGTIIRAVSKDTGRDLKSTRESLLDAGSWEVCDQRFTTPDQDPALTSKVQREAAREQIQRNQENPW
jgi:hypothetical protein